MPIIQKKTQLILALDVLERKKAIETAEKLSNYIDAIKINYPLILHTDPAIITELSQYQPVIADLKIADVPHVTRLIASRAIELGASGVICHSFVGSDSLMACKESACDKDVYAVVDMSHDGSKEFYSNITEEAISLARKIGLTGVIAPSTRLETLHRVRKAVGDLYILSPGVGAQGGDAAETIKAGADFVIVGRSLYESEDPVKTAKNIINSIKWI